MNKVITINLDGIAYQLEEGGYDALRAYLETATARLQSNPDRDEILSDIERALGEKFRALLGSHKTVVVAKEVAAAILELGPIEADPGEAAEPAASGPGAGAGEQKPSSGGTPRRLYRIYDGAMVSGVCNGIATYVNVDPTLVRLAFVLLTVAGGAGVVIYAVMTGSMLTYVPSSKIDLAGPIPQVLAAALGQGAGVWLGRVMILALAVFTVCSYIMIMAETSRLPMVAGWDSILPAWFSKLNPRYRTPVRSLCVIVGLAAAASILASLDTGRQEAFQLIQNSANISFGLYYCSMFAVPLFVGSRFGRRPGFWLLLCAILGLAVTVSQLVLATVPIVEVNSTWGFAAKVVATALVANLVGLAIYWRGRGLAQSL